MGRSRLALFEKRQILSYAWGVPNDRSAAETKNHSYFAYVDVDNIDKLHTEYLSKGADISEVEDKTWGQREFMIRTIDGHRIMFGQEIQKGIV